MKHDKQQGNGQRQQNKNGQCRRSSPGFSRGTGICRTQNAQRFQVESATNAEKTSHLSSLHLLKEKAKRMTKALEDIQARINLLEQQ